MLDHPAIWQSARRLPPFFKKPTAKWCRQSWTRKPSTPAFRQAVRGAFAKGLPPVNRCRARMAGFVAEFRSLLDDATSILRCAQRPEKIQRAYSESRDAVRWLERRPLGGTPMGEFLDSLTGQADRLVSELGRP